MKFKYLLVISSLALVLVLGACAPQVPVNTVDAGVNGINVSGTGKVYLNPDLAYVNIGVRSESVDVGKALDKNNVQANDVAKALTALGVDQKDIQTTAFNVYPMDQWSPTGEKTGTNYIVENTVFVTVRDLDKLGDLLSEVVKSGANNIYGIQFDVTDKSAAVSEARKMAVNEAKKQAQELADATGVKLGALRSISSYTSNIPTPFYEGKGYGGMDMAAAAGTTVSAGQLVITVDASLTYSISQ